MSTGETAGDAMPVATMGYEEAVAELEAIVRDLDSGTINVDVLSERFQRAIDIVEELDVRIARTKEKVDSLVPRLDALGNKRATDSGED